jgi:tRNA threonylcarbamoyladenosine biosynthesis protein TsaB
MMNNETLYTILAIEAATEACSVALSVDGQSYSSFTVCPQQHSQRLLPMIEDLLRQAGIELDDVDYLAYGQGPGSFTGVRIATGVMQGLAMGAELPVIGISTLATLAQQAITEFGAVEVVAAIDARMQEVYIACYENDNGVAVMTSNESVLPPLEAIQSFIHKPSLCAVGTGWTAYDSLSDLNIDYYPQILYPNALHMLLLAGRAVSNGEAVPVEQAQPTYLRDKVTWKKLPGKE